MRLIELDQTALPLQELLKIAAHETVILRMANHRDFVLAAVDEFETESELLKNNKEFMSYLDGLSAQKATISLEDVEKELGL